MDENSTTTTSVTLETLGTIISNEESSVEK